MELRLQLLESFPATGSDGNSYKVRAYDRLLLVPGTSDHWESSGQAEYRLEDDRLVELGKDGALRVAGSGIVLTAAAPQAPAAPSRTKAGSSSRTRSST